MWRLFLTLALCIVAISSFVSSGDVGAQSSAAGDTPENRVVLAKLHDPIYPPITRTAGVYGDVQLTVGIRQDGSVVSVKVVSGPPLLQRAAMESAQQSLFECRGCADAVTIYPMTYSFRFSSEPCCNSLNSATKVAQSQNHISITAPPFCFCDPAATIGKVRSLKCLYLWKCATR